MPYRTKHGEIRLFPHEIQAEAIKKTPQYVEFRLGQEAIRKEERRASYRHYLECIRAGARRYQDKRRRGKFFQKQVDAVMHAIDMGRDPYEMLLTTPHLNEVDRMGNPVDTVKHYGRSPEAQAGANLASIYSSRQFSDEVQKRSNRAGEIIDICMDGLERQARKFNDERAVNPDLKDAEATVTTKTFNKVAGMLFGFYQNTQSTLVRHVALNRGVAGDDSGDDLAKMSEKQLLDIVMRPLAVEGSRQEVHGDDGLIEAEAVVHDGDGDRQSDSDIGGDPEQASADVGGEDCPSSGGCTGQENTAELGAHTHSESPSEPVEQPSATAALCDEGEENG